MGFTLAAPDHETLTVVVRCGRIDRDADGAHRAADVLSACAWNPAEHEAAVRPLRPNGDQ